MDPVRGGLVPNMDLGITELLNSVKEQPRGNRWTKANWAVLCWCLGKREGPVSQRYQFFQPAGSAKVTLPHKVGHCYALWAIQVPMHQDFIPIPDSSEGAIIQTLMVRLRHIAHQSITTSDLLEVLWRVVEVLLLFLMLPKEADAAPAESFKDLQ